MPAIECRSLTKVYGRVMALDSLSLAVPESSMFGLLGPNGSGKSTLLKILAGLNMPTSGIAWIAGGRVPGPPGLRARVGYLPEEPSFYNWMNPSEFLLFVAGLFNLRGAPARARTAEMLEQVGLSSCAGRKIGGFSRGMRQRLGIAQALLNRPSVLLLDEPCSALDPAGRAEVLDMLSGLKERDCTVFMSSHILGDVERACSQVAVVDRGRLLVQSDVKELCQRYAQPLIEIQFEQPAGAFLATLEAYPWVEKSTLGGVDQTVVTVKARDLASARRELPSLVGASGLLLKHYRMVVPTLEEVFIHLTEGGKAR